MRSAITLLALVPLLVLSACSGRSDAQKQASLVAVKVNGDELSVPQVNAQLVRLQSVPEDRRDAVRKQVVEGLIDQQLLVQKAIENKLDRDPEVLAAMESSRAQVLAQAYLQKTLAARARPTEAEVAKYYGDNPALFSERRLYRLQEVATDLPVQRADELRRVVEKSKTLPEVAKWLRDQNAKMASNVAVRGAEALPLQQLPMISGMKDGDMSVVVNGAQVTVLQLAASQRQVLDEKQARPFIEQFLSAQKREEIAKAELEKLRESAKIEYVGEFVKLASMKTDAVAGDTPAGAGAPAAPASAPASAARSGVEKGLSGLR